MTRLKLGVMKMFELCSRLDKVPYKRSSDERFAYLFQSDLRNYLYELGLSLTYYNKMYKEFGLKKDWKENILKIDEVLGGKFQDSLKDKIKDHEKEMELLEKKKKEQEKARKSKLKSRFQQVEKVNEYRTQELISILDFDYPSHYNPYFSCFVCSFELNERWRIIGSRKVCGDCMESVLEHYGVSWYHNHIRYKKEAFEEDIKKVLADKDFIEEIKTKKKPLRSREISLNWILDENDDFSFYEDKGSTIYFLQLKGVSYENRSDLLSQMNKENKLWFEQEKGNVHDRHAVSVWTEISNENRMVGYVPAAVSERFYTLLEAGHHLNPFINSFYTKRYSYKYPDQEYEEVWHEYEGDIYTICMEVKLSKEETEFLKESKEKDKEESNII